MPDIKIDIKRTGFPLKVGELEFWFDSSIENLRKFFNIDELAQGKLKEAQEKAQHIHFPAEINEETVSNMEVTTVDASIDVNKEFIAAQYDILLGDGAFKKIYKKYPDIMALEYTLEQLGVAIADKIEAQEEERAKEIEDKKAKYLNKKK